MAPRSELPQLSRRTALACGAAALVSKPASALADVTPRICARVRKVTDGTDAFVQRDKVRLDVVLEMELQEGDIVVLQNNETLELIVLDTYVQIMDQACPRFEVPGKPTWALFWANTGKLLDDLRQSLPFFHRKRSEATMSARQPDDGDLLVCVLGPNPVEDERRAPLAPWERHPVLFRSAVEEFFYGAFLLRHEDGWTDQGVIHVRRAAHDVRLARQLRAAGISLYPV